MADAAWLRVLQRGCCSRAAAKEKGCALCTERFAAIDRLTAVVEAAQLWRDTPDAELHHAAFALLTALEELDALGSDGDG